MRIKEIRALSWSTYGAQLLFVETLTYMTLSFHLIPLACFFCWLLDADSVQICLVKIWTHFFHSPHVPMWVQICVLAANIWTVVICTFLVLFSITRQFFCSCVIAFWTRLGAKGESGSLIFFCFRFFTFWVCKGQIVFTGIRLEFQEYICFKIMWNFMVEHPGIHLSSIARHACCSSFILFSVVGNTSCMHRKYKDDSTIATSIVVGAILFATGFIGALQEARMTQKNEIAAFSTLLRFKAAVNSKFTRLKVKSLLPLKMKLGWIMYTFGGLQFLELLQFLLDKVIIFTLMICKM